MPLPYLIELGDRLRRGLATLPSEVRARHRDFFLSKQLPDGGFAGREHDLAGNPLFEDGVQADLYYTSFAVRGLAALGLLDQSHAVSISHWLQRQAGRPTNIIDLLSWLSAALAVQVAGGVDPLAGAPPDWPDRLALLLERFRVADGGYAKRHGGTVGSTYHTFLAVLCYDLIGRPIPDPAQIAAFIRGRQREDGGFVEIDAMQRSGTNPTAAAIATLKVLSGLDAEICQRTAEFLVAVRGDDGGLQANTRIPFSDTLSTFTGYLTAHDIGRAELLPSLPLKRYLDALEVPTGGYLAAGWDRLPDVEYSFYGLGIAALLSERPAT